MEGQSEGINKKKPRTKENRDIGCQTDQSTSSSSSYQQAQQSPSSHTSQSSEQGDECNVSSTQTETLNHWETSTKESAIGTTSSSASASASGASTPANTAASSSPAPSANIATHASSADKKLVGPAGVKPNEIEAYFGEKKPLTNSTTNNAHPGQALSANNQQSKTRTASTTGVVGEAKKQVRNIQPPSNNSNTAQNQNSNTVAATNASSSNAASNGTAKTSDGPSWNDESCKLRLVISQFSQLEETMCSPPKSIEGVSWKIMVMPKQHMVQKKQQKCMGFFLQCAPERAYSDQWSVHAVADMRMISYKPSVPHFARRTTHTYTSKENDWGYSCFMTWADIIDEGQGYIRGDTVVLEIAVKAEAPKNMMSHEDFLEKIEKWIVLADMQMKKGNIDLALEANQSAMKFCKGKDDDCYNKLESQRETFVNAKLFESIERIEKGPVVCTDTTHGKPTSLRQALTGAQKSLNGKMTAKGGKKTRAVVTVQHMKKKKPFDHTSRNGTNQQRTNTGPTVKDLVEKRKSSKTEEAIKKDLMKSKEELDADRDDQTESEESPDEKGETDDEDEAEFDDEEYHEGYNSQAEDSSTLELMNGNQDDEENRSWPEDETAARAQEVQKAEQVMKAIQLYDTDTDMAMFQGTNDDNVVVVDRMVQTDFEEMLKSVLEDNNSLYDDRLLAETVLCKFQGPDSVRETVYADSFYNETGIQAKPEDPIEQVFGVSSIEDEDSFSSAVLDSLPQMAPLAAPGKEGVCQLSNAEKLIKSWLDVEGALAGNIDPDGVLARLSEQDRQDLLDELNFKINPLIVSLDHEFRETVSCANNCLDSVRSSLFTSQKIATECDDLKKNFEEKLAAGFPPTQKDQKRPVEATTKKTTSAAATSGSSAKSATNGRPTVIAKRSMKQIVVESDQNDETRGRVSDFLRSSENAQALIPGDDHTRRMRDALEGFKDLHRRIQPMMATINSNNNRFYQLFVQFCNDNGLVAESFKKIVSKNTNKQNDLMEELKKARENLTAANEEKVKQEKLAQEREKMLNAETERHLKSQKEVKDLKNQLKKAESKATKEENRATSLQVQVNDIDEKAKLVRKELDGLKKKSAEERVKAKKEKDRDTQTIRQQSIEISERENERDKARKDCEEANRLKEKLEKEKKAVTGQLNSVTERARAAEVMVMESRWNTVSDELKKRKAAVQAGYTETETLANRVPQVSDREMMRKSLAEWKAALDKCDSQFKSIKAEYDHAIEQIKGGVKSLTQTLEIKLPVADALPNLVKPPPVQVVAPSPSTTTIPAPIIPPLAAGVIGQPRTAIGSGRQGPTTQAEAPTTAAQARARLPQRVPSPPTLKGRSDDAPSSLWSWNTIGNLGELRQPSSRSDSFNSSLDPLQRDIWAANGNGNGSLGSDFLRHFQNSSNSLSSGIIGNGSVSQSPFLRSASTQQTQQQPSSLNMSQTSYQQSQLQQHHQNSQRMQQQQQQQPRYSDMWSTQSLQQQNSGQDYGNSTARILANHNGSGDLGNGQVLPGYAPWHNPSSQQLRGPTPQQQSTGGHHNMFQSHSFFDNGM